MGVFLFPQHLKFVFFFFFSFSHNTAQSQREVHSSTDTFPVTESHVPVFLFVLCATWCFCKVPALLPGMARPHPPPTGAAAEKLCLLHKRCDT